MIAVLNDLIFHEHFLALSDLFGKVYHLQILVVSFVSLGFLLYSFFLVIIRLLILIISYVLI